ncbi:MAG: aminotransferase class V-fold PLP-dependent enzyme [Clostridiales bacterium]|nr:aminotransferase class V-fold PLP-dependent enzyme [Clostridiales bacterium]MDO5139872.1 aminotransferase class V-fold PLP-dependent enzyme [Eubacteriales bacterium]
MEEMKTLSEAELFAESYAPVCEFAKGYSRSGTIRMHMPGHKGAAVSGSESLEALDITEIKGADELYHPEGIILESERNAARVFGTVRTVYSAEGSSLCIRAMLWLVKSAAVRAGRRPLIAAARNVHKTFITASALMNIDIEWMYSDTPGLVSCILTPDEIDRTVSGKHPDAVYITSPDYLGNIADIKAISEICRRHGCLLLVDNAHGAYLKFAGKGMHPIECGADMCCDSAHKTLPVLTGGAYLHISGQAPEYFAEKADSAMSVFASTSPSYLILQSLDNFNRLAEEGFGNTVKDTVERICGIRNRLSRRGYRFAGCEPMKLTIDANAYGYRGDELAEQLRRNGIECEFADPGYLVLMPSPFNSPDDFEKLERTLERIPKRSLFFPKPPVPERGQYVMSPGEAMLSESEIISAAESEGRILAVSEVSCPPAVPAAVCGERITKRTVDCFRYYDIRTVQVVL